RYPLRHLASLTGPTAQVLGIAFSPDGHTLASAGADWVVGLWHVSGPPDDRFQEVRNAVVSGPGGTLMTAGRNHTPLVWKTAPDTFLPTFQDRLAGADELAGARALRPGPGAPFSMAISPDGQLLAAPVTDNSAALWNLHTKKLMASVLGSPGRRVRAVAFSPDGALASASSELDNDVQLRDTNALR